MPVRTDPVMPSENDVALARKARTAFLDGDALSDALPVRIAAAGEEANFDLPPLVVRLLLDILDETAAGKAVSLVPVATELTTHQAAAILNVSRPYLIGLIDKGALPARLVGTHRRLPLRDVLAYRDEEVARRGKGLDELVAERQALGFCE